MLREHRHTSDDKTITLYKQELTPKTKTIFPTNQEQTLEASWCKSHKKDTAKSAGPILGHVEMRLLRSVQP